MEWLKNIFGQKNKRIYLDYAAATPVLPEVRKEMEKYFSKDFYNPNAIYEEGEKVRKEVEEYRAKIAKLIGSASKDIIFTGGGTEANVMAIRGVKPGRIVFDGEVHPSVQEAAKNMAGQEVVLVSSVTTDNKLGRAIREKKRKTGKEYPLLHIDASQTAAYYNVGLEALACDLLTLDSAKLYGPKGCGALVVRRSAQISLPPPGTPAVPLIAGFAKALEIAVRDREAEYKRLDSLSAWFAGEILRSLPRAEAVLISPNIINVSIPGVLPDLPVLALDRKGILVSAGPACNSQKPEPSETPVRLSLGRFTSENEVKKAAKIFCETVRNLLK